MTTGAGDQTETAAQGWRAIRADDSIQFAPVTRPRPPEQAQWLRDLLDWLAGVIEPLGQLFGNAWPVAKWILLGLAVAGALVLLWRVLEPLLSKTAQGPADQDQWLPQRGEALALLEDADRLAAEGRFDEATHLLLHRSVGQIAAARPDWVEPSSTVRELAALPALPDRARHAFGTIASQVERSVFALRSLGQEEWELARGAYAEFALQQLPGRPA